MNISKDRSIQNNDKKKPAGSDYPYLKFEKLAKAAEIAYYYGFLPIATPEIQKDDVSYSKKITEGEAPPTNNPDSKDCPVRILAEEKIALLRTSQEKNFFSRQYPAMVYYENRMQKHGEDKKKSENNICQYNLDIIGTSKSIAEAELVKTGIEILRDEGFEDLYVDINSLGDKDSMTKYTKELSAYFRKNLSVMSAHCRQEFKKDIFTPLLCDNPKCKEIVGNAPKPMTFLDEVSRAHFKEVLEFIESMNIPYKLDHCLVGNRKICQHTVFMIKSLNISEPGNEKEETLAVGFRYNGLAKKMEMKKDIPAVGLTIAFKKKNKTKKSHSPKKPKVYFIQLGFGAKLKSLEVIEELRKAKITLHQALAKDKLSSQIATAESMKIPVSIIMGQKEAMENSVIVRDMSTRFQETVKITDLAEYLKKYKLHTS